MNVRDLRKALEGLPDEMRVLLEVEDEDGELAQASLRTANSEFRCDDDEEMPWLYLWGSDAEDVEDEEEADQNVWWADAFTAPEDRCRAVHAEEGVTCGLKRGHDYPEVPHKARVQPGEIMVWWDAPAPQTPGGVQN